MKQKRNAVAGNGQWQSLMAAISAGRGESGGRAMRGSLAVGAYPTGPMTQLPAEWDADVAHASHIVYHYETPIAWIDGRDGGWVVPEETYSPMTSGVQNRIREHLFEPGYRTTVKG